MSDNAEKNKQHEVSESSHTERRASEVGKTEVDQALPAWMEKKQQADEQFKAAGLLDKPRDNFVSGTIGRLQIEGDNGEILVKGIPPKGQEPQEAPVDTPSELGLKALGENDPRAQAMYEVRKGIKTHMPEGEARDHALAIAKETETDLLKEYEPPDDMMTASDSLMAITPDMVASGDYLEGRVTKEVRSVDEPIGWLDAAQRIAELPFDQQLQVIGAGLGAGFNEYNRQQQERSIGALVGTVQGVGAIATNLGKVADFSAYLLLNDHERAGQMGAEFGEALGSSIVGGVRLFDGAHRYLNDVGKAGYQGDYTKVFRDLDNLGKRLDQAWSELPPREQARIISKLGTELAADGLIGLGAAKTAGKLPGQFTKIMDTVANDAQRLHQAGQNITHRSVRALEDAIDPVVQGIRQKFGPRFANATAYGGDFNAGAQGIEDISKGAMALEKRKFISKLDPNSRLTPIEAAREHAHRNGTLLDEKNWKKLTPEEKARQLTDDGYTMIEEPPTKHEIVDSLDHDTAFRGDHDAYSELNASGLKKSYIDRSGDLTPANVDGLHKGKPVEISHHVDGFWYKYHKANSPYTSFSVKESVTARWGDDKVTLDLKGLREAISSGEVRGVEIVEHAQVLEAIENSNLRPIPKNKVKGFAIKAQEILVKGVIPEKFIKVERK